MNLILDTNFNDLASHEQTLLLNFKNKIKENNMFQGKQAAPRVGNMWINKDPVTQKVKSIKARLSVEELKKLEIDEEGYITMFGMWNNYRQNDTQPHFIFKVPSPDFNKKTSSYIGEHTKGPRPIAPQPASVDSFDF